MPTYEPVFSFETGTLRLVDEKLFRPTEESVDRWVAAVRPSYRMLGICFDVLYQLTNDRFVHVHCIDCQRQVVPSDIGTPLVIWHTSSTEARLYSNEKALRYLVQFNFKIPECLTYLT